MKFPRLPHPKWPGAREVRERMLREQRQQRSAPPMRRRAVGDDNDDEVYTGNCGRPVDAECGLINPLQCALHAPALLANDDDQSNEAKSIGRQVARLRHQAMRGEHRSARRRIERLERLIGPGTASEVRAAIARERLRTVAPAVRAVIASFPLQRW